MNHYRKRNRSVPTILNRKRESPVRFETELTLRLSKSELFDSRVISPHSELDSFIYASVNQLTEKYLGDKLILTIYSDPLSDSMQDTFREIYREHYEDEYQKIVRYLTRRYIRVIMLLVISVVSYYAGRIFAAQSDSFVWNVISNIGVFCLWEIGYTHFDRKDAADQGKRIVRARDAEIHFE